MCQDRQIRSKNPFAERECEAAHLNFRTFVTPLLSAYLCFLLQFCPCLLCTFASDRDREPLSAWLKKQFSRNTSHMMASAFHVTGSGGVTQKEAYPCCRALVDASKITTVADSMVWQQRNGEMFLRFSHGVRDVLGLSVITYLLRL